jgi:hypothetical protein
MFGYVYFTVRYMWSLHWVVIQANSSHNTIYMMEHVIVDSDKLIESDFIYFWSQIVPELE